MPVKIQAAQRTPPGLRRRRRRVLSARDGLDPQTSDALQNNLAAIDAAIGESRAALVAEPQSEVAQQSLLEGLKTKVALLQTTAGAAFAADTGGATVSTNPAGARLMMAWSSGIVGRSAGLRFKQRRARSANSGGRVAGKETASDRSLDHVGADRVSASTMITPRDQMSPAAEVAPSLASGGSYTEDFAILAEDSPTGRMVSLASFS